MKKILLVFLLAINCHAAEVGVWIFDPSPALYSVPSSPTMYTIATMNLTGWPPEGIWIGPNFTLTGTVGSGFTLGVNGATITGGAPEVHSSHATLSVTSSYSQNFRNTGTATCTLPDPVTVPGKSFLIKSQGEEVNFVSTGSNQFFETGVQSSFPLQGNIGRWCLLLSDGTYWNVYYSGL